MQFNTDTKKQANEVIFTRKSNRCTYPPVTFNNNIITTCPHQKYLGVVFCSKLDFSIHIKQKIRKCKQILGLIRRLSACLPMKALPQQTFVGLQDVFKTCLEDVLKTS